MITHIEPFFDEKEKEEILKVIESTFISEHEATAEFERRLAEFTCSKHVITYSNGSLALLGAYSYLNLTHDDEVIVPNLTFIATANSVLLAGGRVVLCDVDKDTFCLDPVKLESMITNKTKAIVPVHLYGVMADMDNIMKIAKKHNLLVIEDAAESFGSSFNGRHSGTIGDMGILSFYGNKTITTAEGGAVLTQEKKYSDFVYMFKNVGREKKGIYIHDNIGHNFRFTDLQAAIGLAQLRKIDYIIDKKNKINAFYKKELKNIKDIFFQQEYKKSKT
ncbi:DegT/DnrJ/EryC1/StrS family aminotransferase, partial [bacterium]|nr:DegT/DnrJ/EryC1/StrS family aminotransferase [bacterium]